MELASTLKKYQFPEVAISVILSSGIKELYPPQAEAIEKGILDGNNLLMSVPTAAGKTLIAELCMLNSYFRKGGRCLYIAPLKALASEKFRDFHEKYSPLGIKTGLAIGDLDSPSKYLNSYDIIVATAEKIDSLLRSKAKWLIDNLAVVVLDEIHFINDGSRGPTMEILTARIKQLNKNVQILALSATVSNALEMSKWLDAQLVTSSWRPIPLKEGVYFEDKIIFNGYGTRVITEEARDDINKVTLDTLRSRGQVLIFVNSRRSAQAVSRQVCSSTSKILTPEEKKDLLLLSKKILGAGSDATKICHKLAETVVHGAAFHHAGLKPKQRELIEENFKINLIKVIGCTPTLAAGVNLPARRAIIRDCKRFEMGIGQSFIPTSEYKQCAGRAGRPQYDDYGEAVLMAKSHSESSTLFEKYILAEPEPVISKLANETSLRIHILSSIAGGYVNDVNSMFEFISHTFLYHQRLEANILDTIANIFEFLHREGFIEKSGIRFFATALGALTSRLYIDPVSAIMIREGLRLVKDAPSLSPIGLLHLMCCCPDGPCINIGKNDSDSLETFASHFENDFLLTPENTAYLDDYYGYYKSIKTTWMLNQWIEEDKEDSICDQFNIGPGDIYRHLEATQWLLHAGANIADLLHKKSLVFKLENLNTRVRYGIKEELLNMIHLKGVGRIRARILYDRGFRKMDDLKYISTDELGSIKQIGKKLAGNILSQIKIGQTPKINV